MKGEDQSSHESHMAVISPIVNVIDRATSVVGAIDIGSRLRCHNQSLSKFGQHRNGSGEET